MNRLILFVFLIVINLSANAQDTAKTLMSPEQMPVFAGGDDGLHGFLSRQIKYPMLAMDNHIHGTVIIQFVVKSDGYVDAGTIKILRSLSKECDDEVIRVVKAMPKWTPGKDKGKDVSVYFNLPVVFQLNDGDDDINLSSDVKFVPTAVYKTTEDYVKQNTHYPLKSQKANVKGEVIVKLKIDKNGYVTKSTVLQSLNKECDKEALRVIKSMPLWSPKVKDGQSVESEMTLTIPFPPK
jgi:TonB family protein